MDAQDIIVASVEKVLADYHLERWCGERLSEKDDYINRLLAINRAQASTIAALECEIDRLRSRVGER